MKTFCFLLPVVLSILVSAVCVAQDVENSKDYSLVQRWPHSSIAEFSDLDFDAFDFETPDQTTHVEGRTIKITYFYVEGFQQPGDLKFVRNYQNALSKAGWTLLTSPENTERVVGRLSKDGKEIWTQISPSNGQYQITVVERGEMKQEVSASDLLEKLNSEGRLILEIHFDTAKATIKDDSLPTIKKMVEMLKSDDALRVEVQGHTDNRGSAEADQILSEQRANAVAKALSDAGINPSRLVAKGYGLTRPIADNATEEGRAKNRRVELVKIGN